MGRRRSPISISDFLQTPMTSHRQNLACLHLEKSVEILNLHRIYREKKEDITNREKISDRTSYISTGTFEIDQNLDLSTCILPFGREIRSNPPIFTKSARKGAETRLNDEIWIRGARESVDRRPRQWNCLPF